MDSIEAARLRGARERLMERMKKLVAEELPGCQFAIFTITGTEVSTITSLHGPSALRAVITSVLDALDEAEMQKPEPDVSS